MEYTAEMSSDGMMQIPVFMKFGVEFQAILRLYFRNLRGLNVGNTDERDL
jgi:hypothetical protein